MENGIIRGSDIIDVNDLKQTLEEVDKQLLGLEHSLQEHSSRMRIEISNTQSVESLQKIAAGVQSLVDAMAKVNEAKEANKQALRDVTNELKLQAEAAKVATEQEKTRTQASKSATEQAKQQTEYERQFTEAVRQEAEQKKADAKATAELTIANAKAATEAAKVRTEAAKLATEQAKQQKIQSQMNNAAQRRNAALQQETQFVKDLRDELENNRIASSQTLQQVSLQNMAYSELSQIASVLGQRLKEMSAEEKKTGADGAEMVRVTKEINEELARQDANVARYSRNVGNYRSAFDGLGYSIQQVLREVPSALNVQQFFLAISNNIPMVVDQMKMFRQEQENIKEQLETMTEGTEEYMKLQGKQMSLGKKFLKSILSWQTAILAVLMLLRRYGDDMVKWFVGLFKKVDVNGYLKGAKQSVGEMAKLMSESLVNSTQELAVITKRLESVTRGTDEWRLGIKKVNELTHSNLNATTATIGEVKKVTDAYIEQAKQIAKNNAIVSMLEDSNKLQMQRTLAKTASSKFQMASALGIKIDESDDDWKEFEKLWKGVYGTKNGKAVKRSVTLEAQKKLLADKIAGGENETYSASQLISDKNTLAALKGMGNAYDKAEKALEDYINKKTAGILTESAVEQLMNEYKITPDLNSKSGGGKSNVDEIEDMNDRYWEALEARIKMITNEREREEELLAMSRDRELEQNEIAFDDAMTALDNNLRENLITQEEYEAKKSQYQQEHDDIEKKIYNEHTESLLALAKKYYDEDVKAQIEHDKKVIESIKTTANNSQAAIRRRVKTEEDESIKNRQIAENIEKYRMAIIAANQAIMSTKEGREEQLKFIDELRQKIAALQAQIDHTKQISTYSSIGDMLTRKGVFEGGDKRAIMENLLGSDAYAMYEEGSEAMMDAIAADYDKWLDATESALTTWYNTTIGYIGELITAFTELSQAKADAAKEDTETAKEAYDREKALLDAGYASRVDAAWNEYLEKKAIQEQAEKDAKKAQLAQQAIDTATQASSLVTAIANMFKTMSAIPGWGVVAAGALSASMLGLFTYTKAKAIQATQYGEGGFEMVEQGGSHASGNDTELGVTNRHGKRMVVERNEGIGVFNTRAMRRYGRSNIERFVRDINQGGAALASVDADRRIGMTMVNAERVVKLDKIESGLNQLVDASKSNTYVDKDGNVIVCKGNVTTKYLK